MQKKEFASCKYLLRNFGDAFKIRHDEIRGLQGPFLKWICANVLQGMEIPQMTVFNTHNGYPGELGLTV
jgi:hypothetical protein